MIAYLNKHGNSGVKAYELGDDFIRVQFKNNSVYRYTAAITGADNVAQMKQLAQTGRGLSTFISQSIKSHYAIKEK